MNFWGDRKASGAPGGAAKRKWIHFALAAVSMTGLGYTRCGSPNPPANPQVVSLDPANTCQRGEWHSISRNRWENNTTGDVISNRDYQRIPDAEVTLHPGECFRIPDCAGADPLLLGHFRTTGFNFVDPRPAVFSATGESRSSVIGARFVYLFEPPNGQQDHVTEFLEDQEPEDALFLCARDDAEPTAASNGWRGWVTIGQTAADKTANGEGANQGYALFRYVINIEAGAPAMCGDGSVDAGEQCDDGNNVDGDGCRANCTLESCGDGMVDPGEACDDGNTVSGDGCRGNCTVEVCGDGILDSGEACDDGNTDDTDACRNDCTLPMCGDGMLDPGEQCDDGNNVDGDGCSAACVLPVCGDGTVDPGESCDDGNTDDNDGCRNDCTIPVCGDGFVDSGEECDDGNANNFDGCRADCTLPYCGDGIVDSGEACDDGNATAGDGCENDCTVTPVGGTFDITNVRLTPDVNILGGVRPRYTADMAIDVVVDTTEGMVSVQAEIVSCNPALVTDCTPVSDTPPSATSWALPLSAFSGAVSGQVFTVLVTAHGPGGQVAQATADLEVYPVDAGLDVTCTKRYDAGSLYLSFTLADNGNLPPGYTLGDMFDARFWLYQEGQDTGFTLDETDSVRTGFTLVQPTEFNANDDGEYEMIFTGLLGFVEPIQIHMLVSTNGGPNDVCTLIP